MCLQVAPSLHQAARNFYLITRRHQLIFNKFAVLNYSPILSFLRDGGHYFHHRGTMAQRPTEFSFKCFADANSSKLQRSQSRFIGDKGTKDTKTQWYEQEHFLPSCLHILCILKVQKAALCPLSLNYKKDFVSLHALRAFVVKNSASVHSET